MYFGTKVVLSSRITVVKTFCFWGDAWAWQCLSKNSREPHAGRPEGSLSLSVSVSVSVRVHAIGSNNVRVGFDRVILSIVFVMGSIYMLRSVRREESPKRVQAEI